MMTRWVVLLIGGVVCANRRPSNRVGRRGDQRVYYAAMRGMTIMTVLLIIS